MEVRLEDVAEWPTVAKVGGIVSGTLWERPIPTLAGMRETAAGGGGGCAAGPGGRKVPRRGTSG